MKILQKNFLLLSCLILALSSCNNKPGLQSFMATHSEQAGCSVLTFGPDIIQWDKKAMSPEQKKALESFKQIQILIYKPDSTAAVQQTRKVQAEFDASLIEDHYDNLIHVNGPWGKGSLHCLGENNIKEYVLAGSQTKKGMVMVRIQGKDLNPTQIGQLISALPSAKMDQKALEPILNLLEPNFKK
ncbi:MAG: hypothetical protein CFE24_00330 [Flavobacterium sp. BFFFF2]|nr:MAG: hypothetical protein CFE24_00330 [Flavobacterium sp. BFFFF2]